MERRVLKSLVFGTVIATFFISFMVPLANAGVKSDTDYSEKNLSCLGSACAKAHLKAYVDAWESYPYMYFYKVYHKAEAWVTSTWWCTAYVTYIKGTYYHNGQPEDSEDATSGGTPYLIVEETYNNVQISGWVGTDAYATYHYVIWPGSHHDTSLETQYNDCKVHPSGPPP